VTSTFERLPLERLLSERTAVSSRLDQRCAALLKQLRDRCPGAVAPPTPAPGGISEQVTVKGGDLDELLRAALPGADGGLVLLTDGDSELLIDPARCRTLARPGLLLVVLGVECDQTGTAEVTVPFAVGSDATTTGMLAATEGVPRGPQAVVTRWADALVALAWEALLSVAAGVARHAGSDRDVLPLLPGALVAVEGALTVVPQARHEADRPGRR
jgi:hypothetical protein